MKYLKINKKDIKGNFDLKLDINNTVPKYLFDYDELDPYEQEYLKRVWGDIPMWFKKKKNNTKIFLG
jgi:hypothetical protein